MGKPVGITLLRVMDTVDKVLIGLAQLLLIGLVMITFVSVVGRTFFNFSVADDLLISEMIMVALVFLPLSFVQSVGGHLEVTILTDMMPKPVQNALWLAGLVLGIMAFGLLAYLGWGQFVASYQAGDIGYSSVLDIPEWPAKLLIPLGLGWWCLRMAVQLFFPVTRPAVADSELNQALHSDKYQAESSVDENDNQ